jgi:ABC-type bacteriocin/lantibiotic exporter with double-glycine peptidase domain
MPVYIEFVSRAVIITELFDKKIFLNLLEPNNIKKQNKLSSQELNNIKFNNIEFKNIHFKYDSESIKLFDNLNIKINIKNKIIGLTGLSGNGKSTLIKLLLKLYPYEGTILIDNIDVKNIDTNYLRKKIIYIDQSSNLFDKKIIENINYGIDREDENENMLSKKYFDEIMKNSKINELYNDINFESKNAGFNGSNLSGGQRQVINLINGLITPSIITVLDEPTNALDPDLKKEVIKIIKNFKKYNKCIIIITHDKDLYEIFDENIVL